MNTEELNYWNDRRVRSSMINYGKIINENGRNYIFIEEADEGDIKLLCKWEVCPVCEGNGTHVNPNIDCNGLTSEDFDDPDFAEGYFSGRYDQTCNRCGGRRVIPGVDYDNNDDKMIERYGDHLKFECEYAAEVAAERAMGA